MLFAVSDVTLRRTIKTGAFVDKDAMTKLFHEKGKTKVIIIGDDKDIDEDETEDEDEDMADIDGPPCRRKTDQDWRLRLLIEVRDGYLTAMAT